MEYMPGGDLRSYLHKSRKVLEKKNNDESESRAAISQTTILQFALDIANGMTHLAERQVGSYKFKVKV